MTFRKFLYYSVLLVPSIIVAQDLPYWEDPSVIGINKEAYHSTLTLPSKKGECDQIISLNGMWSFFWSKDPENIPENFFQEAYDYSKWNKISVPGTIGKTQDTVFPSTQIWIILLREIIPGLPIFPLKIIIAI